MVLPAGWASQALLVSCPDGMVRYRELQSHLHRSLKMVGSAGNAPVVASGWFEDTGFTDRQPDHFPYINW